MTWFSGWIFERWRGGPRRRQIKWREQMTSHNNCLYVSPQSMIYFTSTPYFSPHQSFLGWTCWAEALPWMLCYLLSIALISLVLGMDGIRNWLRSEGSPGSVVPPIGRRWDCCMLHCCCSGKAQSAYKVSNATSFNAPSILLRSFASS